jgi:iron complex outermembrane receptor protein
LESGFWFEGERWNLARRFYATSTTSPMHSLYDFPSNPFFTQWEYVFDTTVYDFHLQDVYRVNNKLALSAGFKTEETAIDGELSPAFKSSDSYTSVIGKYAQGSRTSGKPFLPQFGANYKLDKSNEIFGDAAYNVRAYVPGGYGFGNSPWGTTQAGFDAVKSTLKPETSWTEEAGYRYNAPRIAAQATLFRVNYANRLLAFQQGPGIAGGASLLGNAGGVTTNGVDAAITLNLGPDFSLYNGGTWNKSTYDNVNYYSASCANNTCTYNTKGKVNVDTPEGLYKTALDWHKYGTFAHIGADYMSRRYDTFSNDEIIDGRFLTEIGIGYKKDELGALKDLKAQVNATNLLNSQYYGPIGTNGFAYSNPVSGDNPTIHGGAPRTISGTLSVRF